jgi:multidrug efflux pump subunit AcrB
MNFATLYSQLDPQMYVGGDSVAFWGPMSWTVIFGLSFATFMTLIVVPAMYLIGNRLKLLLTDRKKLDI